MPKEMREALAQLQSLEQNPIALLQAITHNLAQIAQTLDKTFRLMAPVYYFNQSGVNMKELQSAMKKIGGRSPGQIVQLTKEEAEAISKLRRV